VSAQKLAVSALVVSLGTVGAYAGLIATLSTPLPPTWYLGMLGFAALLAVVAVWRARRWLTVSALVVSGLLLVGAGFFNFVAMRVPASRPLVAVGASVPDFTLPDAAGRPVSLSDYRGKKPVILVFYRGYW
jgi:AhpC/TSA family protein